MSEGKEAADIENVNTRNKRMFWHKAQSEVCIGRKIGLSRDGQTWGERNSRENRWLILFMRKKDKRERSLHVDVKMTKREKDRG